MGFIARLVACVVFLAACVVPASGFDDPGPVGLTSMENFSLLPYLWNGVQARGQSSYDRTELNKDERNWLYTDVSGKKVLLDVTGPGCVYRFWITSLAWDKYNLYFEFDDNPALAFTVSKWNNFFDGTVMPFGSPFAEPRGTSSGGYISYYPMQFRTHCRILADNITDTYYYNIAYHTYTDASAVTTYNRYGTYNNQPAADVWNTSNTPSANPGTNPADPVNNPNSGAGAISAGSSITLANFAGQGVINSLSIKIPQIVPNDATSAALLSGIRIKAWWDGDDAAHPSVDCPIGEFFGCGVGENRVASLPLRMGIGAEDAYYCYFPMPFGSAARIELHNTTGYAVTNVQWNIVRGLMTNAASLLAQGKVGYFHTYWKQQATETDNDYIVLQTAGRGCLVGCVVTMRRDDGSINFLEGDERIHIDGSLTPAIYGTGTEDFFNCAWYYKFDEVTLPSHGCPFKQPDTLHPGNAAITSYRHMITDKIPYYSSLRVGLEHGDYNNFGGNYSSAAFYYEVDNASLIVSDSVDVGDAASEAAHTYSCTGQTGSGLLQARYQGDNPTIIGDGGRKLTYSSTSISGSRFRVAISPNNIGVKLRRRLDYSVANQQASVYVDGVLAGDWYEPGNTASAFWRDSDFEVPAALTAGKSAISVEIRVNSANQNWTEYRYTAFSCVNADNAAPAPPANFAALGLNGGNRLVWVSPADVDLKAVLVVCRLDRFPTSPTDGVMVCDRPEWAGAPDTMLHDGLDPSTTYYYAAFSYDSGGRFSTAVRSQTKPDGATCSDARRLPEGAPVTLTDRVVTVVSLHDLSFSIEDPDRASGIRVSGSYAGLEVGDLVDVAGVAGAARNAESTACEPMILNAVITNVRSGGSVKPLGATGASVGGDTIPPFTPGVAGSRGVNTTGLLLRLTGRVTEVSPSAPTFYLDDGSRVTDGAKVGVLVKFPKARIPVAVGDIVSVSGVAAGDVPLTTLTNRRTVQVAVFADLSVIRSARTRIAGVVKDSYGSFVPRATVTAGGYSTTAADDGSFVLEVAPGSYTLNASKGGYTSQAQPISLVAGDTKTPSVILPRLWTDRLPNGNCEGGFFDSGWGGLCMNGWGFQWRSGPKSNWGDYFFGGDLGHTGRVTITTTGYESGFIALVQGLTPGTNYRFCAYAYQTSTGTTTWISSNRDGVTALPPATTSFANVAGQWNYGEASGTVGSTGKVAVFVWGYRQSGSTSPVYFDDMRLEIW